MSTVAQELPTISVLSTGGTIASRQDPAKRRLCGRPLGGRPRRGRADYQERRADSGRADLQYSKYGHDAGDMASSRRKNQRIARKT